TVDRLEKTAGSVTGSLMARASKVDRDLVVALQDFDRLQQEFVALSNALNRSAGALRESSAGHRFAAAGYDAIAAIAVSDLPERLTSHLRQVAESAEMAGGSDDFDGADEAVF